MDNQKILLLFGAIFALACLPFLVIYPSGEASAGLSHGFLSLLEADRDLLLVVVVGLWSVSIGRDAILLLPITFILLYAIAAMVQIEISRYPMVPWFVLGAILAYALSLTLVDSRKFVVAVAVSSSIAFHVGMHAGQALPTIADPLYFLLGQLLALSLMMSASVCFAIAFLDDFMRLFLRAASTSENRILATARSWLF
jgi:hydrogenase/urease accessory protein HupE